MDSAKILLVEDDQTIAMGLEFALCQEGYTVTACARISEARQALSSHAFHLAILDINLPDGDGYALCKQIKQASPATSIIFLTVHEEEMSAVMGLELALMTISQSRFAYASCWPASRQCCAAANRWPPTCCR